MLYIFINCCKLLTKQIRTPIGPRPPRGPYWLLHRPPCWSALGPLRPYRPPPHVCVSIKRHFQKQNKFALFLLFFYFAISAKFTVSKTHILAHTPASKA